MDPFDTVRFLKDKIHANSKIAVENMSLYFAGMRLDRDFARLDEYGIEDMSEIRVVENVRPTVVPNATRRGTGPL